MEHSKKAPSAAKRWFACPGSINLSEGIEVETSDYAKEGSAAHFVAQHCLKHDILTSELADGIETFPQESEWVDKEMFKHVDFYLKTVNEDFIQDPMRPLIEEKVDLSWLVSDLFGTVDAAKGEFMGKLIIYDLKYGQGVLVEPENNPQLMIYGLGMVEKSNPLMFEEIEFTIIQPRIYHPDGPVRRWSMPVDELRDWGNIVLKPRALATEDPNAPLHAGAHCQFCPAMGVCDAVAQRATELAMVEFSPVQDTGEVNLPAFQSLTIEQMERVFDFSKILVEWSKGLEAYLLNKAESGVKLFKHKLVKKRGTRKWKNENEIESDLSLYYGQDIYTEAKLKSPSQMEQIPGMYKEELVSYWVKADPGNTLAPIADKRKEVQPSAVEDFSKENDLTDDDLFGEGDDDLLEITKKGEDLLDDLFGEEEIDPLS